MNLSDDKCLKCPHGYKLSAGGLCEKVMATLITDCYTYDSYTTATTCTECKWGKHTAASCGGTTTTTGVAEYAISDGTATGCLPLKKGVACDGTSTVANCKIMVAHASDDKCKECYYGFTLEADGSCTDKHTGDYANCLEWSDAPTYATCSKCNHINFSSTAGKCDGTR